MSFTNWKDRILRNPNRGFQPGGGGHGDSNNNRQRLLLPPDESTTIVPRIGDYSSSTAAAAAADDDSTKKFFKILFSRITIPIPRFLGPRETEISNNVNLSEPLLVKPAGLVTRMTPILMNYLQSRRDRRSSSSSIISDSESSSTSTSTSTAAVPPPPKGSSSHGHGHGLFTRFKQKIRRIYGGSTTPTTDENLLVFHKPEKHILIEEGLPTPPVGRWYSFGSSSLAQLKSLADRRDDYTKEVEAMDTESAVSLGKFSASLLTHLGVLVFTDAKIESCEHLKYLGFLLFCALGFESILGYMAVRRTGNARWKHIRVGEEVAELKRLMEDQLRQMEIPDVDDHFSQLETNKAGFERMLTSCKRIIRPLEFGMTLFYQVLTILLTISTCGITINKSYNAWKSVC